MSKCDTQSKWIQECIVARTNNKRTAHRHIWQHPLINSTNACVSMSLVIKTLSTWRWVNPFSLSFFSEIAYWVSVCVWSRCWLHWYRNGKKRIKYIEINKYKEIISCWLKGHLHMQLFRTHINTRWKGAQRLQQQQQQQQKRRRNKETERPNVMWWQSNRHEEHKSVLKKIQFEVTNDELVNELPCAFGARFW